MHTLQLAALAICMMLFSASVLAQDACPFGFGGEENFDALAKALSDANSCQVAVRTLHECMWVRARMLNFLPSSLRSARRHSFQNCLKQHRRMTEKKCNFARTNVRRLKGQWLCRRK